MVKTLYDLLDKVCRVPERPVSAPMRMPISGIYKIKGVGDVLAGRVPRQHSRSINLLSVKQIAIGCNKTATSLGTSLRDMRKCRAR